MGINEEGFLSPDIQAWARKHRTDYAEAFAIASELNVLAVQALHCAEPPSGDKQKVFVAILFIRLPLHFEAAIILAERGAVPSAMVLVRAACEALFSLATYVRDARFVDELVRDDRFRRADLMRALLDMPWQETGIEEEKLRELQSELKQLQRDVKADGQARLRVIDIARRAELLDSTGLSTWHIVPPYTPPCAISGATIPEMRTSAGKACISGRSPTPSQRLLIARTIFFSRHCASYSNSFHSRPSIRRFGHSGSGTRIFALSTRHEPTPVRELPA
jgi:hypothetical protein